jgi:lipopolysaccharide export system permease protein
MMKILDRYITGLFVSAVAIFTTAFTALFVTVDLALNLGKFLELRKVPRLQFILWFYSIRIPLFLELILPIVVLFAAIFTVIKLQRTNEVLPIAASGISLRRMSLPFLVAAVLTAGGVAALEEFALPSLAPELARTGEILSSKEVSYGVADYIELGLIWGKYYDHVKQEMHGGVRVTLLDVARRPVVIVEAERCRWNADRRQWIAFEGTVEYESETEIVRVPGERPKPRLERIPSGGWAIEAPFKIENLRTSASSGDRYAFASFREILREARTKPNQPVCQMRLHSRLAFPCSPVVLVLVGLPSVVAAHSKSFVRGLTICSLQMAGYLLLYFGTMFLGNLGTVPAPLAAWFAPALFGCTGLVSFSRMKT